MSVIKYDHSDAEILAKLRMAGVNITEINFYTWACNSLVGKSLRELEERLGEFIKERSTCRHFCNDVHKEGEIAKRQPGQYAKCLKVLWTMNSRRADRMQEVLRSAQWTWWLAMWNKINKKWLLSYRTKCSSCQWLLEQIFSKHNWNHDGFRAKSDMLAASKSKVWFHNRSASESA